MSPAFLLFLFGIGLCVGSFANVLILRFGFTERPRPRSHCMACDRPIVWYDLLPVVSFAALNGRCRSCKSRLSIQYPLVELSVAILFALAGFFLPPALSLFSIIAFLMLLFFLATLVALTAYDIRHTLVPTPFLYGLIFFAAAASFSQSIFTHSLAPLVDSALGGGALFIFFVAVILLTRGRGMGSGDAYVALAVGVLLGFERGIEAVLVAVWTGSIVGLTLLFLSSFFRNPVLFPKGARVTMKTELPLVPFIAFGVLVALFTNFSPLALAARISNIVLFSH